MDSERKIPESKPSLLDKNQLNLALDKIKVVDRYEQSGLSLSAFAAMHGIPESTLRRHVAKSKAGFLALVDGRKGKCGRKMKPVDERVFAFILCFVEQHPKATIQSLHDVLKEQTREKGWTPIGYSTLRRVVRCLPDDLTTLMKEGRKVHFDTLALVGRKSPDYPNASWQVDVCELPIWTFQLHDMVLFKPYQIIFIDCATRVVMGWRLFRYEPTTSDLLLTLRMAIFAKHDPSYPFCGVPDGVQSDNGGVFESADYADCLVRLKVVRQEIPIKSPSANGKVERFFETIQDGIIRRLHGHSDQFDGLASAKKKATSWDPLIRNISHFMATYHSRIHSELKTSPSEAWHAKQETARGLGFSIVDVLDATMVRLQAQVQRDGVHLPDKNIYSAACLTGLVDKTITVRVSPDKPYDRVEAYWGNKFLGLLGNIHQTPEIAEQIQEARVERSVDLHRLHKIVNTMAEAVLPPTNAAPPAYIVDPLPALFPVSAPKPPELELAEIPVIQAESAD